MGNSINDGDTISRRRWITFDGEPVRPVLSQEELALLRRLNDSMGDLYYAVAPDGTEDQSVYSLSNYPTLSQTVAAATLEALYDKGLIYRIQSLPGNIHCSLTSEGYQVLMDSGESPSG